MSALPAVVVPLADKVPTDNDVVAGWVGFAVFMFLVVAVALLLWSFSRQLKKTRVNFGVDEQRRTIPVAGTPEGDAALAEALIGPEPGGDEAGPRSATPEPGTDPDPGPGAGRHRA